MMTKYLIFFLVVGMPAAVRAQTVSDIETAVMDKDYEEARLLSAKLLHGPMEPAERIQVQYYLGLSYLRLGQNVQARKAFQMVMRETPNTDLYDKAALGVVESLAMAGFHKDALAEANSLLRRHPDSPSKSLIYLRIARANLKLMQWQKAREYLQKVIDEFPQSFEAPLAKALMDEKEFFAVQVGSFLDKGKAVTLVEELKDKDQYAYIVETISPHGKVFYRVRVGQVASLQDAQALETQLSHLGYPTLIYP